MPFNYLKEKVERSQVMETGWLMNETRVTDLFIHEKTRHSNIANNLGLIL